ncbi:succinylglutamate desuccinylase/aspartoacylase family protein [Acetobacter sp. AN02]|uniref:succinylglutamate desuccinylase/aspartoacylase domain-containing protein n=1 Tax=Acetobacter sp. AN02 TaxID=2894186 RepID=UPI0024341F36|nr:succinylglutamate desuccinylase/aspartoacylase family protein [Acetobacter sp. AN02]MDG6095561.1 succinylglutamate desuccinylase/aspartoacylase family protein [Acetobacter sp. AN02]
MRYLPARDGPAGLPPAMTSAPDSRKEDADATIRRPRPRELSEMLPRPAPALPPFRIGLTPPDLSRWRAGNTGIEGVHTFRAEQPGPHVVISALMHGNEFAGAIVLDELLSSGFRPVCGTLSVVFLNLAAFDSFDPGRPALSRFLDEDMNRLWGFSSEELHGSRERERVRSLLPLIGSADMVLDLHSMLWPGAPALLCSAGAEGPDEGPDQERGQALARRIGAPRLIVTDQRHRDGLRLIDMPRFTAAGGRAAACLLEAGEHWMPETVADTRATVARFLAITGMTHQGHIRHRRRPLHAKVERSVAARTAALRFTRNWRNGDIVPERGTVIARDGGEDIRTPWDHCMLILPNLRPAQGHTAVRFGRIRQGTAEG